MHKVVHTISAFSASEQFTSGSTGKLTVLNSTLDGGVLAPDSSSELPPGGLMMSDASCDLHASIVVCCVKDQAFKYPGPASTCGMRLIGHSGSHELRLPANAGWWLPRRGR